jgi:LacI family transcriptional regulator
VTLQQVAHRARVSAQTVSRVINNYPAVAPRTRLRVQRAVSDLRYQPNVLARSLVHRRSFTLGVVATGLEYFGPSRTLVGIERKASELGYSILLHLLPQPQLDDAEPVLRSLLSRQVDGIIWAVPEIGANRSWLRRESPLLPVPIVFLSMHASRDLPVVCVDNCEGGRLAVDHLLAQGYRQIGLITGPLDWWEARERRQGWRNSLMAAGLAAEERQVFEGDWTASSGERGFSCLTERFPEIDAVFAGNDQMALGVLQAAHRRGLKVPSELGVVGFDDVPECAYFWPPLTTVRQELRQLGGRAVQHVADMILARRGESAPLAENMVWLAPKLVVRFSSIKG